jgi:2-haloacid dehalogenase
LKLTICPLKVLYKPFNTVTHTALLHALAELSLSLPSHDTDALLSAYDHLELYPDVLPTLQQLSTLSSFSKSISNKPTFESHIFSNGTREMLIASIRNSKELSKFYSDDTNPSKETSTPAFKSLISIDDIQSPSPNSPDTQSERRYKPSPESYFHLGRRVGIDLQSQSKQDGQIWLISSNPFDIVGGMSVGLKTCWIDRMGKGWCDGLGGVLFGAEGGNPTLVVNGFGEAVSGIRGVYEK